MDFYKNIKPRNRCGKIAFLLARIFGKKKEAEDSGYKLTSFFWRNKIYVAKYEKITESKGQSD